MFRPLVSIIIPVYNGSDYMREAIDSALMQTYERIEVIVINDGSDDNGATDQIARSYGDKIRYFVKDNGGVSSALNLGIKEMSGEYFSWLSHDDVYEKDKIERQVAALDKVDGRTLIYCKYSQINELSEPLTGRTPTVFFSSDRIYGSRKVLMGLLEKSTFNGCCLLIPKSALIESELFDESLRFCQDAMMWYKIFLNKYSLYCINDVLVKNRIHAKQLTQTGQHLFKKECSAISKFLMKEFAEISTAQENFLKVYLLSDAKFFDFEKVREGITIGKKYSLLSATTIISAYLLCLYGKVRPLLRMIYYRLFRNIKVA